MNDLLKQHLILGRGDGENLLDMFAPRGEIGPYLLVFPLGPKLLPGNVSHLRDLSQYV